MLDFVLTKTIIFLPIAILPIAVISDVVWQALITAMVTVALAYMTHMAAKAKSAAEQANTLIIQAHEGLVKQETKLGLVSKSVEEIKLHTNSMKDALVDRTKELALVQGEVIGREKAEIKQELKEEKQAALAATSPLTPSSPLTELSTNGSMKIELLNVDSMNVNKTTES